jgi:L-iditol 2-dehydrogenase
LEGIIFLNFKFLNGEKVMSAERMKVLRLHGVGDLRLHSEPIPQPAAGEVLLKISAVGICGSDLHWFDEASIGDARISKPLVLGHEFSAVVEDSNSAFNGQRVAVDPAIPCQECEFCLGGNPNLCINLHFAGHGVDDGALSEYLVWPERNLYPLPGSLNDEDGVLLEPLGVALHAVELGLIRPGAAVGVFGVGPIGLMIVQLARLAGASEILVTDRLNHRLETALSMGGTQGFLIKDELADEELWDATNERGVDVAFEVAGENQAVETAINAVKPGGRVILVGIPSEDKTTFTASTARRKGLTIKLSRRMSFTYPHAMQLVDNRVIDVRSLVTHRYPLVFGERAFQVANQREGLKVVILP